MAIDYAAGEFYKRNAPPAGHSARDMVLAGRVTELENGGGAALASLQAQIDANDAVDAAQQAIVDTNAATNAAQQSQLDANDAVDAAQQAQIDANDAVDLAQQALIDNKEDVGIALALDDALQVQVTANADLAAAQQAQIDVADALAAAQQAEIDAANALAASQQAAIDATDTLNAAQQALIESNRARIDDLENLDHYAEVSTAFNEKSGPIVVGDDLQTILEKLAGKKTATSTDYETLADPSVGSIAVVRDASTFMQRFELTGDAVLSPTMEVGDTLLGVAYLNTFDFTMPVGTIFLRGEFTTGYANHFELKKVSESIYTVSVHLVIDYVETLVFSHELAVGGLFTSIAEVNSVDVAGKYSILDTLEDFRLPEGNFRFRLKYPDTNIDILFEQDTNPVTGPVGATAGFNIIEGTGYGPSFKGMALSSSASAAYNGMLGSSSWWYPMGAYASYLGGIPASDSSQTIAQLTEFYAYEQIS